MPVLCPACRSELDPSAASCPICLRSRSRDEIMRSYAAIKKEELRRRRLPYLIAGALALAGLAVWKGPQGVRQATPVVRGRAAAVIKSAQDALDRAESPETWAPGANRPIAAPAAPAAPPQGTVQAAAAPANESGERPAEDPCAAAPDQPAYAGSPPAVWRVRGRVFELLSLTPVPDVRLAFTSPDGKALRVLVDESGRYSATLAPLTEGGYSLSVTRSGRKTGYLEEALAPFAEQSAARRAEEAADAAKSKVLHVPIVADDRGCLAYDVALLPARGK